MHATQAAISSWSTMRKYLYGRCGVTLPPVEEDCPGEVPSRSIQQTCCRLGVRPEHHFRPPDDDDCYSILTGASSGVKLVSCLHIPLLYSRVVVYAFRLPRNLNIAGTVCQARLKRAHRVHPRRPSACHSKRLSSAHWRLHRCSLVSQSPCVRSFFLPPLRPCLSYVPPMPSGA